MAPTLGLVLGVAAGVQQGPEAPAAAVIVVPVTATEIARTAWVSSTLVAREEAVVNARLTGREITEILIEEGTWWPRATCWPGSRTPR